MQLKTSSMIRIALFAALIAVGSYIRIPLGPVPFTLQNFFIGLAGFLLGPRDAFLAVAVFIVAGLLGVPVFPSGGGLGLLLHPTFGFILGFGLCAWICGCLGRGRKSFWPVFAAASAGFASVYLLGIPWLWYVMDWIVGTPISFSRAVQIGCLIFIPTDLLKVAALSFVVSKIAGRDWGMGGRV